MFKIIVLLVASASAAILDCDYKITSHPVIGNSYTCHARVLKLALVDNVVNGITQNHMKGRNSSDVIALVIQNQNCEEFLQDIDKGFPNLEAIVFTNSHLKRIKSEDLKPFSKLKYLSVSNNALEELDGNLFEFSSQLQQIDFQHNLIRHVGPNILKPLLYIQRAYFHSNICISRNIDSEAQKPTLNHELATKCPPTVEMYESLLVNGKLLTQILEALNKKDNQLEARILQMENFLSFYRNP